MSAALVAETVDAIVSAALADFEGLEGLKLLSPARSVFGIAFELTEQFKATPRTGVQSKVRARLEGYLSTPVKGGRPKSPTDDSLPPLLSKGRADKLHIENEAKKQAAERAGTKKAERVRRLSDWLKEKASHALKKRNEVLAEVSQKAKKHCEAVGDKLKRVQEAEEHRREELRAKLQPSHALEKRKEVLAEVSQKARKHGEAVEDKLKRAQEAEEYRREELRAKLQPSHALEKRKEVLAEVSQKARKHGEAVEDKLKRVQEAEEQRREELRAKLQQRHSLEKRKEVLAEVSQKARKHGEAVEDKLKQVQEAEEQRREELRAKLQPSHALEKRKEVLAEVSQKAKKHGEAVEDKLKRVQEAEEHRRDELRAKLEPNHSLEKRKEVLAEVSQKARKHGEAVEDKLKRVQEAEEHRREELRAKLERKTGSKVSGKVSDGLESPVGAAFEKLQLPACASGEEASAPCRLSEPELQSGWIIMSAALVDFEGLEGMKLLSPERSASGIAFELTDQFKATPRTGVQSKARARLEGYLSTSVKGGRPKIPTEEAERVRRFSNWLEEKASHALEKRKEVLAEVSQKARKHGEAVEDKLKWVQEAEEHRREELRAKLQQRHSLEKRKEVLAEVSQKARKHGEAVEDKLKRVQEAEEHRRDELRAKLERKTGSKVSGKVSDGLESPVGAASKKFQPPARAGGEAASAPRRLSEPELQSGWIIVTGVTEEVA